MEHFVYRKAQSRDHHTQNHPTDPVWNYGATVLRQNNQGLGSDCYLIGKCLSMEVNSVHVHFVAHSQ